MRPGLYCPRLAPVTGGGRIEPQAIWGRRRAEYAGDNRDRGRRDSHYRRAFGAGGNLREPPQGGIEPSVGLGGRSLEKDPGLFLAVLSTTVGAKKG